MKPTHEQLAIIDASKAGESLVGIARAGTGKTATLCYAADACSDRSILLVCFNKSAQIDAERRLYGRPWVDARTWHSVAYNIIGKLYGTRLTLNPFELRAWIAQCFAVQIERLRMRDVDEDMLSSVILDGISHFCHSADDVPLRKHLPNDFSVAFESHRGYNDAVVDLVRAAWMQIADLKSRAPIMHDFYLKEFALRGPELHYDAIWLDEAQDGDAAMVQIMLDQENAQRILIGDNMQQIYAFRDAIDALDIAPFRRLALTMSWRFGAEVAKPANYVLAALGETNLIQGCGPTGNVVPRSPRCATMVLARSNAGVVEEAIVLLDQERKMCIIGGAEAVVQGALAAYAVYRGEKTRHPTFRFFESWAELENAAQTHHGSYLRPYVRLVMRYQSGIPALCKRLLKECVPEAKADVVVGTVHSAKGKESDHVRLAGDFPQFCYVEDETGKIVLDKEEGRLSYVALTRAIRLLEIGLYVPKLQESLRLARLLRRGITYDNGEMEEAS